MKTTRFKGQMSDQLGALFLFDDRLGLGFVTGIGVSFALSSSATDDIVFVPGCCFSVYHVSLPLLASNLKKRTFCFAALPGTTSLEMRWTFER